jgi:hypothetical protein
MALAREGKRTPEMGHDPRRLRDQLGRLQHPPEAQRDPNRTHRVRTRRADADAENVENRQHSLSPAKQSGEFKACALGKPRMPASRENPDVWTGLND